MAGQMGQAVKLNIGPAANIAAFPAANLLRAVRFYSDSVQKKADWQPNPVIGGISENDFDTLDLQQDMPTVEGQRNFPLCVNQAGDIFSYLFGVPVTTGAAAPFLHTFKSGVANAPRLYAVERRLSATRQRRIFGECMKGFSMEVSKDNGVQQYTISSMGRDEQTATGPLVGVLAERAFSPLNKRAATIVVNGSTAADALSLKIDYQTGIKDIPYLDGTGLISAFEREDDSSVSGSIVLRTNTDTFHNIADGGALGTVGCVFGSGSAMFQLSANVRFGAMGQPVQGRGGMECELSFQGMVLAASPMLTVAFSNALPSGTYT
jgi:hypothetical protein